MSAAGPRAAALALCVTGMCVAGIARADGPTPELPPVTYGNESVASVEAARGARYNPAAIGVRYPSELLMSWRDVDQGNDQFATTFAWSQGALSGNWQKDLQAYGLALAGGAPGFRTGVTGTWLVDPHSHEFTVDARIGVLSRASPALSWGAVVDHVAQPAFGGRTLPRTWQMGIAVRPLAISRPRAHTLGTRLTLGADVLMAEGAPNTAARTRLTGELEIAPGVALRAGMDDHGGLHLGLGLLNPRMALSYENTSDDGDRRYRTYSGSFHQGEDQSVFASRADQRVVRVPVSGDLGDESLTDISIFGNHSTRGVGPVHKALEAALTDPLTRGVLLDIGGITNMSAVEELRARIVALRAAGKPVVAYMEYGGGRSSLYLAAACDGVVASEEAYFASLGLRTERRYFRKALADLGVRMDRASIGKYKSAYRNYSVDSTTAADREVIEHTLDVVQERFVADVSRDRHIPRERLETALDGRSWSARELVALGVIDSVGYRDDARRMLGALTALGAKPRVTNAASVVPADRPWILRRPVAVVYASGDIAAGRSGTDLLTGATLGDQTFAQQMRDAFRDPEVKAVVLRVDSPGGSTTASNLMLHAAQGLKRETGKPLIVSMGSVAASGGYYIALAADRIYCDRLTRTGSIGVLFVQPSFEGFYAKHGVRQDFFERGAYMRGTSGNVDWDARMQAAADSAIGRSYELFMAKVAEGRRLPADSVARLAQGRVWLGDDALANGLVDEIGGLDAAIAEARRRAHVPDGEKIDLLEVRRPRPTLLERVVGQTLRGSLDRLSLARLSGEPLYLADDLDIE